MASPPKIITAELSVTQTKLQTPDILTVQLNCPPGMDYWPGQWAFLFLKDANNTPVRRAFSMASSPTQSHLEFTIKLINGQFTSLLSKIKAGDTIALKGPFGDFGFRDTPPNALVLLAGGTGVTPLMSMLRYIADKSLATEVLLVYCTRTPADIAYRAELEAIAAKHANIRVVFTLTRPLPEHKWKGSIGRISANLLKDHLPTIRNHHFFICGPDQMTADTMTMLTRMGAEKSQMHKESWG